MPSENIRCRARERCRLQYSKREPECLHCIGLSDAEAVQLKNRFKQQALKLNAPLAGNLKTLLYVSAVILLFAAIFVSKRLFYF